MSVLGAGTQGRLYRDADRAILGGVCAGLAEYLGFNLKVTRVLAFIAFLMVMPVAVIGYLAAVFIIPAQSRKELYSMDVEKQPGCRRRRKKRQAESPQRPTVADEIDRRCSTLDERLIRLEKHVTSRRFQLDQELSRL